MGTAVSEPDDLQGWVFEQRVVIGFNLPVQYTGFDLELAGGGRVTLTVPTQHVPQIQAWIAANPQGAFGDLVKYAESLDETTTRGDER